MTANKLNKLTPEKAHTNPPHYYDQTGGAEGKAKEGVYEEMEVESASTGGQRGKYKELELGTLEKGLYESLNKTPSVCVHCRP